MCAQVVNFLWLPLLLNLLISWTVESLFGWDFDIDPTRPPSHLLSGINQHGGFTLPPDSGSGLDWLGVLNELLFNTDDDDAKNQECSLELQKRMNELGYLVMEGNGVQEIMPLDSRKQQSIDSENGKNTRGRPMIEITSEELLQCKGRTLVAVAAELNVSICTLKRRLEYLTGYKKWTHFRRSKSFPPCVPIYVD